ncbi:MAG: pyridoxal phosphate-dependent aminotransferase [Erysipelotrichaceae bacterium]|nr:pyridoxal phosphate-dependent aminotransferase [Erysipelotrichaceae bacterium]
MVNKKMYELGAQKSKIRELFEYGEKLKQQIGSENVFDFSIGNPSVPCPNVVSEALINIVSNTNPTLLHGYTIASGLVFVRKQIADYLNKTYDLNESYEYIYLTAGAAAALTISLNAILCEDDEVIVFAPFFPEYKVFVEKAQGKLVICPTKKDTFLPDINMLDKMVNEKTKVVIINSPNNPTGVVYHQETIINIANLLKEKEKKYQHPIFLLSDEPYRELIYSNTSYPFITKYYDNAIVNYSFSKSLSLPGERIGYILIGANCKEKDIIFKAVNGAGRALGFVCESSMFQYLIPYCLGHTSNINIYKENRDILYNALKDIGYQLIYPEGAFYLFMKALEDDDEHFSNVAKKYGLLIVPSTSFGMKGYVRISYCVSKDTIINSLKSFKKLYEHYKVGD